MAFEHQNYTKPPPSLLPPPPPPPPQSYHHFIPSNSDYTGNVIPHSSIATSQPPPTDKHFLLYGRRYIHPKLWNGCPWVEIKYFQQDPRTQQLRARKGGICLSMIEFEALVAHIPLIRQLLKDLTAQSLPSS